MIIDKLSNIGTYAPLLKGVEAGLAAVRALGENPQTGRYEFDGGYFMVQEGVTKPMEEGDFEAHRKYIDVQIILEGLESVGWADIGDLKVSEAYRPDTDKVMFSGTPALTSVLGAGMVWVAFGQDGHKACRHEGAPSHYRKVIMKLPMGAP